MTPTEQRLNALAYGNEIRFARAEVKRELREVSRNRQEARQRLARLLQDPPEVILPMDVSKLLCAAHGVGTHKTRRYMCMAGVAHTSTVESLTERQRRMLAKVLAEVTL